MNTIELRNILEGQKIEVENFLKRKTIQRDVEPKIKRNLDSNLIKVISGPRRAGKSFLSLRLISDYNFGYMNFDDERLISLKTEELNKAFELLFEINNKPEILFFDEIQNIDGWEIFINRLFRNGFNVIITGSNSKLLSRELSSHLTGRYLKFELMPFSFNEYLKYRGFDSTDMNIFDIGDKVNIKLLFDEYVNAGGFAESYPLASKNEYLQNLFNSIVMKDIISRYHIKYTKELKELAMLMASNYSSKISYNKIKKLFDIGSVHTIKKYLDYLEESYLFFQLNRFSHKVKEQISSNKKIYLIDQAMINSLNTSVVLSPGRLLENIVFLHLKRRVDDIFYGNIENKHEIDFVIRDGVKITQLIQVCYLLDNDKTINREFSALIEGSKQFNTDDLNIITYDTEAEEKYQGKKIKLIPAWKFLLDRN